MVRDHRHSDILRSKAQVQATLDPKTSECSAKENRPAPPPDVTAYHGSYPEESWSAPGYSRLEFERTKEILVRTLPAPPGPIATMAEADARTLPQRDGSAAPVLVMGPLHHLAAVGDRLAALRDASRVVGTKPSAPITSRPPAPIARRICEPRWKPRGCGTWRCWAWRAPRGCSRISTIAGRTPRSAPTCSMSRGDSSRSPRFLVSARTSRGPDGNREDVPHPRSSPNRQGGCGG